MNSQKWMLAAGFVLALGFVAGLAVWGYRSAHTPLRVLPPERQVTVAPDAPLPGPVAAAPQRAPAPPEIAPPVRPRIAVAPRPARANRPPAAAPAPPPLIANAAIDLPVAREALTLVGADPMAEAIWFQAINNPDLSEHDRQDLIEDLNEEGFADPKNLTADDLPVIENRLALIEQLAPDAMDDVNAAAFAEAYKDLVEMYGRLVGP